MSDLLLTEHKPTTKRISNEAARALASVDEVDLRVTPAAGDGWKITPGSKVGSVRVGDLRVVIRPKIGIRNVLLLMGIVLPERVWHTEVHGFAQEPDLLVAMVQVFRRGLDLALGQGMRRDYEPRAELLRTMRGRIDIGAAVRRPGSMLTLPCRFDDHTADFELNRVLFAAAQRALRVPEVPIADRRRLHRHLEILDDAAVQETPLSLERIDEWRPSYLDRHYEAAVRAGVLLLRSLSISDEVGGHRTVSFVVDMNKLVEAFITAQLKRRVQGEFVLSAQHITTLDMGSQVSIRPDVVVLAGRRPVFVADVKYKAVTDVGDVSTDDLFQLATYANVLGVPAGALITVYAEGQAVVKLDHVIVRNALTALHVWPIDLTGNREVIDDQLDGIAGRICQQAAVAQAILSSP